jgi:signal transduction histidine kinase
VGRALNLTPVTTAADRGIYSELDHSDDEFGPGPREREAVEVYVRVPAAAGRLMLECHYDTADYEQQALALATPAIAISAVALLILLAGLAPVVLAMLRRVRDHERDRAEMAEYALTAAEHERRAIAAGVHDTVVQDLAGATYAFSALERDVAPERRGMADAALDTLLASVASLRGLLVELYPESLTGPALPDAIENLLAPLRRRNITVASTVALPEDVDDAVAVMFHRVVREAFVNINTHSRADAVTLTLASTTPGLTLTITDNGVGLPDLAPAQHRRRGGLALLSDRVNMLGGTLDIHAPATGGTVLKVVLPPHPPTPQTLTGR